MKRLTIYGMLLAFSFFVTGEAFSQAPDAGSVTPATASEKEADFSAKYDKLVENGRRIYAMQNEYPSAPAERQWAILEEGDALYQENNKLFAEMNVLAKEIYAADTAHSNEKINKYFIDLVTKYFQDDNYEEAYKLVAMLIKDDLQVRYPELLELTGVAAFMVGLIPTAERYFERAKKEGVLTQGGTSLMQQLGYYKTAWEEERKKLAAEKTDDDLPRVLIKTTKGDILVELFENEAPNTVANFISLVEKKYYDGLTFHRVIPEFVIQGGCPKGDGTGGPGYTIKCETNLPGARKHFRGYLSMAHAGKDTGGSQFFITLVPTQHLDGGHTVFGRVIDNKEYQSKEVLSKIERVNPNPRAQNAGPKPDVMTKVEVLRKRPGKEYKPVTSPEM